MVEDYENLCYVYRNMDGAIMQHSPREPTCSICQDYFTDPFTLGCGHRFCSPCICLRWEEAQTPACCPVCGAVAPQMDFKNTIFASKKVPLTVGPIFYQLLSSDMQICGRHQEIKNLICGADRSLLCLLCTQSPEHANHRHCPIQKAAEYHRENLLIQIKAIWKTKQKNQRNLNRETNIIRAWEGFVNLRMVMIRAEYPKVFQYLHEEKQKHLEVLAHEGKVILHQLKRSEARMAHMGKLLQGLYKELKELYLKADVDLLQNLGDIMKRIDLVQRYMPQPLNPKLSAWAITGMSERLNSFRVYITLDRRIGSHHMSLLEDLRRLQYSPDDPGMACNPAPSEYAPSWGAQLFTAGKHYWEVDVGSSCNWAIGLCKESWTERNDMRLDSEDIFLLLCVQVDDHFSLFSTSPLLPHYIQRPRGWVGVFVDYECGTVSFVNVAKSSLICNFLSQVFYFPLRPFICCKPK
ncbi:tripartite motif-containing protein 77 [Tupaia chinensis]|uniref:tripartite motif-containing protein 77 n=1 Tax=Tupaia chinensis TaxID=246437 RepID=UPI0003C90012|nr:tripartite motif-containing protein 77 [Tupaia chinensis]